MSRILIRTGKRPGTYAGPEASLGYRERGIFGVNVGNYLHRDAVFRWVSVPGVEVIPDSLVASGLDAPPKVWEQINAEFDQYVFSLTNSLRGNFTKRLVRWARLLEHLTIPVVGVGLGVQLGWDDGLEPGDAVDRGATRFLRALLNRSAKVSVRGETTAAYLKRLGFGDEHVEVTGCPSLYLYGPDYQVVPKGPLSQQSKIAMTIAISDSAFAAFADRAFVQYPELIYIGQTAPDLATFLWGLDRNARQPDMPIHLNHPYLAQNRARMFLDPRTWIDFLRDYEFMFGTRIHGNVAALLAGVPATLISMDKRTHELGLFHDIPTIRRPDLKADDTVASIFERSDWTAFNQGLLPRYDNFCRFFDSNGVAHIGQPGKANPAYDQALAEAVLPPPVEPIMHHGQIDPRALLDRLNWLRAGIDETAIAESKGFFAPEFRPTLVPGPSAKSVPPVAMQPGWRRLAGRLARRIGLRK